MRNWCARFLQTLAVLALLFGATAVARADIIMIGVNSNFFDPSEISIATGDTICWVWNEGVHTSTSSASPPLWDSGLLPPGSMFDYTFGQAGDYPYYCTIHLECCNMVGIIHVIDPVVLQGTLRGADADPNATGSANYLMRPDYSTLSVAVQNVSSTQVVDVFVNNQTYLGTIVLDGSGSGELDLNTLNGDNIPNLQDGDEIEVYDASDDTTLIVIGNVSAGN